MPTTLEEIRAHALEHYENGWDVIVEAFTDDELAELMQDTDIPARTPFERVAWYVDLIHDAN